VCSMRLFGKGEEKLLAFGFLRSVQQSTCLGIDLHGYAIRQSQELIAKSQELLVPQHPHHPAGHEDSADEQGEAIQAVVDLLARCAALRDAENNRGKNTEQHGGTEMGELQVH